MPLPRRSFTQLHKTFSELKGSKGVRKAKEGVVYMVQLIWPLADTDITGTKDYRHEGQGEREQSRCERVTQQFKF